MNANQFDMTLTALRQILPMTQPADAVMSRFFREHPKLGAQDRHVIAETVFGILRRRMMLEAVVDKPTARGLLLGYLVKVQGLPAKAVASFAPEAELKMATHAKAVKADTLPIAVQAEFPDWLYEKLRQFMDDEAILALGRGFQQPAPLDVRVNTLRMSREAVMQALIASGLPCEPTPYSPLGLRLQGKPAVNKHALFNEGAVEVQDEGSQLLGLLLSPRRGEMVVDFCAGAGGKTLLLGALMQSSGRVYALDVSEKRLNNLKPRLKRSGLSNVHPQLIAHENDTKIKRLAGKIDRVLVDAPCSGLGTLRRNPDLRFRQSAQSVAELTQKQASILAAAASLVKQGGRLVYATCSILPEENQQIVEAFLAAHPDFKLVSVGELLTQQKIALEMGDYLQLYPQVHGTDGFFAAVLTREVGLAAEAVETAEAVD
ncbi:16S rRNA (cytosine967-C5)-methyltransferase [Chitinivorax tropicus]|uniref:16S rRNA (Cytosine967-C5)-methyltransferase n=1 Tax=Chitinivorax tropicus TaxID=714531 RepID=A0A840MPD8_9PROT|nr:RsmB/NOP family class I SAM-dependent RNA methyltransferase [Chitinivorax tropicus]MBB5018356.1 16S rRNA (cytosine967-C5)-methyltransferase [Chitinivorax tropicus]